MSQTMYFQVEEVSMGYVCFQFNVRSDISNCITFMIYLYMVME